MELVALHSRPLHHVSTSASHPVHVCEVGRACLDPVGSRLDGRCRASWQQCASGAALVAVSVSASRAAREQRKRQARVRRRADESSSDAPGEQINTTKDGGLSVWRAGKDPRLPCILFSDADLLLLGHTKRMHLFEPRWVNMINAARESFGGMICLVYFDTDSDVKRYVTIAEIIACNQLGPAGYMVVVRGVARGELKGLAQEVVSPEKWGLALVNEISEIGMEDVKEDTAASNDTGAVITATSAATELGSQFADLNLTVPASDTTAATAEPKTDAASMVPTAQPDDTADAQPDDTADAGEDEEGEGPQLWTHERPDVEGSLSEGLSNWVQRCIEVEATLTGVPLSQVEGDSVPMQATQAVAALYAGLGVSDLNLRWEIFCSDRTLTSRLQAVTSQLKEMQAMARAKRSLAALFAEPRPDDGDK